ncbi:MAG: hypothetical protein COB53_03215 [Elusimicrobia bacterium]|nr:MAG: hypothetical protein COB53_03215 [Elusimicrobiota bacterium]
MTLIALLLPCLIIFGACATAQPQPLPLETVYLLHGLGRSRASMWWLGRRLKRQGYRVVNFPYVAAQEPLSSISDRLRERIEADDSARYHFVTHSLGGIIVREGFREGYPDGLGRIVMLAPPNHPPLLAKGLKGFPPYQWVTGDSGAKLTDVSFYEDLPIPSVPFGILAGTGGNTLLSKEKNDGVILVKTARLKGMADFKEVPHSHTFLMNSSDTGKFVLEFLRRGRF